MSYRFIKKPNSFMKDYIAVHGHLPKNELPKRMRGIRYNSVYIRANVCDDKKRASRLRREERNEMRLMEEGKTYKQAHRVAHKKV
jgi:hypothetical protein